MAKKYIENTGREVMFVGGCMIQPGEGRDIDEMFLPPEHRTPPPADEPPPAASQDELLEQLRAQSIAAIKPELSALKQEALDRLAELEGAQATPRTTLLGLIDAERLRRSNEALEAEQEAHRIAALGTAEQRVKDAEALLAAATPETRAAADAELTEARAALAALQGPDA
ncbi:hypothetical protein DFR41_104220 [Pseudacidovorax intermedius]|uniref:Uncharacterized protein n=1 Tax=Pseudacidovorax intermedius TaxID=433924 RepID=A0A370FHP2_9BURK|nr:hypothetical protein [Pseudacidovorax intermedius]RDI25164.1 hypothetical protein DFR41_104220 [Pseudacidovorax intermedius]